MVKRIIIEGSIGCGKSTVLSQLKKKYEKHCLFFPEAIESWKELSLFYSNPTLWCLPFSLRVLITQIQQYKESQKHEEVPIHIFERCPLSCRHVFTQLHFNDNVLSEKQWMLFKDYYELLHWEPQEENQDCIIYIETPVQTCLQRIKERGRECECNIDEQYLHKLEFQYKTMLHYVKCPVHVIDGTQSQDDVLNDVKRILDSLL
jgi:deoxyadenosine/deoxycytidine kinase